MTALIVAIIAAAFSVLASVIGAQNNFILKDLVDRITRLENYAMQGRQINVG